MAVVIEAITIVVCRDAVRRAFRGNEAAFEALAPNRSGRKDSHLLPWGSWTNATRRRSSRVR